MDRQNIDMASKLRQAIKRYIDMVGKRSGLASYNFMLSHSMLEIWTQQNPTPGATGAHTIVLNGAKAEKTLLIKIVAQEYWFHIPIRGLTDDDRQGLKSALMLWANRILDTPAGEYCIDKNEGVRKGMFLPAASQGPPLLEPSAFAPPVKRTCPVKRKKSTSTAADVQASQVSPTLPLQQAISLCGQGNLFHAPQQFHQVGVGPGISALTALVLKHLRYKEV
ncbi:hypothetical protein CYMTET_12049 [Cymbomonas tetramitiformis]|uniref:Uncharacterized protein n=1 Tax=Cymbomonas tetramitiformis TaxID=36881 RepID=A0AAE0LC84_9CHLO|nr:hypothetical protein CYMTET_12049 [Cymbomonas tetramitiformis]